MNTETKTSPPAYPPSSSPDQAPTVVRVPQLGDRVHFFHNARCFAAIVVAVWGRECVNLFVPPTGAEEPARGALDGNRNAHSVGYDSQVHARDWSWHWPAMLLVVLTLLGIPSYGSAQTLEPPKNPTLIGFTSPDHATLTAYEVDFVRVSDHVVVQTVVVPKDQTSILASTGEILVTVNVQPTAFGSYVFVVRAVAADAKSANSEPSETWQRAPGPPTRLRIR